MKKIAIIGAGSYNFTRAIARDIFTFPALADSHIALVDLPEGAAYMDASKKLIQRIIEKGKYPAKVTAGFDRREAIDGADAVIITIRNDLTVDAWSPDLTIPKKYGVDTVIGDTRGPSGIFRFLRMVPAIYDICRDIEELAPGAIVLNYSNPMDMVCSYVRRTTDLNITGLCHSVQGTAAMLAKWIGAPMDEITYLCGGINHQAFYLKFERSGKNAYPDIFKYIKEHSRVNEDGVTVHESEGVRNEMCLGLGYYPTESSGHNSEYNAWFRKRQDLIDAYVPDSYGRSIKIITERNEKRLADVEKALAEDSIDISRGKEYASYILNAIIGDGTMFEFNGNVENKGLITNLPYGCTVEVPVVASKGGMKHFGIGALPPQIAALNTQNVMLEELAVEGALIGDKETIYHAIICDPLTSAVCSLAEIRKMTEELFAANEEALKPLGF